MVGVLANHVPTIGVLKPGVVQVYENDGMLRNVKYFGIVWFYSLFHLQVQRRNCLFHQGLFRSTLMAQSKYWLKRHSISKTLTNRYVFCEIYISLKSDMIKANFSVGSKGTRSCSATVEWRKRCWKGWGHYPSRSRRCFGESRNWAAIELSKSSLLNHELYSCLCLNQ